MVQWFYHIPWSRYRHRGRRRGIEVRGGEGQVLRYSRGAEVQRCLSAKGQWCSGARVQWCSSYSYSYGDLKELASD